jgi:hypothetical protein
MTQLSPENLDRAFALLVECAVKGERCPVTSAGPDAHHLRVGRSMFRARAGMGASASRCRPQLATGHILTGAARRQKDGSQP